MIFAVACFAGYLWSTYVVPETGNVSLEEMDEVFGAVGLAAADMERQAQINKTLGLSSYDEHTGSPREKHDDDSLTEKV